MSEESDKSVEQTTESNVDIHLSEHEGATKFYVVFNKKNIPFYFDIVCYLFFFFFPFCCLFINDDGGLLYNMMIIGK